MTGLPSIGGQQHPVHAYLNLLQKQNAVFTLLCFHAFLCSFSRDAARLKLTRKRSHLIEHTAPKVPSRIMIYQRCGTEKSPSPLPRRILHRNQCSRFSVSTYFRVSAPTDPNPSTHGRKAPTAVSWTTRPGSHPPRAPAKTEHSIYAFLCARFSVHDVCLPRSASWGTRGLQSPMP